MLYIGSHVGYNKNTGLLGSVKEALSYDANTFMFYTGAPQNTIRFKIDQKLKDEGLSLMKDHGMILDKVIVHAPYIINLANPYSEKHQFAINFLKQEVARCEELGITKMVLHPGSHVGMGIDVGIENIIDGLNEVIRNIKSKTFFVQAQTILKNTCCRRKNIVRGLRNKYQCINIIFIPTKIRNEFFCCTITKIRSC